MTTVLVVGVQVRVTVVPLTLAESPVGGWLVPVENDPVESGVRVNCARAEGAAHIDTASTMAATIGTGSRRMGQPAAWCPPGGSGANAVSAWRAARRIDSC